jgi:hypothetical protein
VFGLGLFALTTGCPISDLQQTGIALSEGGGDDAQAMDVQPDVPADVAAEAQAETGPSGPYYRLDDAARWTFFDVASVGGSTTYSGVVFDQRYLYFVPNFSPPVALRYDTKCTTCSSPPGTLTDPMAWSTFSMLPVIETAGGSNAGSYTYLGGSFDGQYVYFAPFGSNTFAVQYDTQQPFTDSRAWAAFDASVLDPNADYWGATYDGQRTYLVPNATNTIVAYTVTPSPDGGSGFGSASSWTAYQLGSGPDNRGFWGGLYDGHNMYLAPFSGNVAVRHVAGAPVSSSWSVGAMGFNFNVTEQISPPHFWGAAFDGQTVYFIPYKTSNLTLAAYATSGNFNDDTSWSTYSLTSLLQSNGGAEILSTVPAFVGAAFDGRRVILAPAGQMREAGGVTASLPVVAYDTTMGLTMPTSYETFDPSTLSGGARAQGFEGVAFDGQYVYFVPHVGSVVARFQATHTNIGLSPISYRGSWW